MNPIERLIAWLSDPRGDRRRAQERRIASTDHVIRKHDAAERVAMRQIRRAQEVVGPLVERMH
ncbi:MAG TPA: hypothetical protein VEW95_09530 [Candidatus Limnocylindrales bacterium]|nr:hypothetical protein [Candidatus Limnocylindrales bacterium]